MYDHALNGRDLSDCLGRDGCDSIGHPHQHCANCGCGMLGDGDLSGNIENYENSVACSDANCDRLVHNDCAKFHPMTGKALCTDDYHTAMAEFHDRMAPLASLNDAKVDITDSLRRMQKNPARVREVLSLLGEIQQVVRAYEAWATVQVANQASLPLGFVA